MPRFITIKVKCDICGYAELLPDDYELDDKLPPSTEMPNHGWLSRERYGVQRKYYCPSCVDSIVDGLVLLSGKPARVNNTTLVCSCGEFEENGKYSGSCANPWGECNCLCNHCKHFDHAPCDCEVRLIPWHYIDETSDAYVSYDD